MKVHCYMARVKQVLRLIKRKYRFVLSLVITIVVLLFLDLPDLVPSIIEEYDSVESLSGCDIPKFAFKDVINKSEIADPSCTTALINHSRFDYLTQTLTIDCPLTYDLSIVLSPNYVIGRTRGKLTQTDVRYLISRSPDKAQLRQRQLQLNGALRTMRTGNSVNISISEDELFTVTCNQREQLFIQTISKPDVEQRLSTILAKREKVSSLPPVILLEFVSVSRAHFYRKMLHTTDYIWNNLSKLEEKYTVVDLRKYHALGRNTDPNIRVLFCASGKYGWGKSNSWVKRWWRSCRADDYIFNVFKRNGYMTSWAVNMCQDFLGDYVGTRKHFRVDYETVTWACHPDYDIDGQWSDAYGPYGNHPHCINGKYVHTYLLDYVRHFVEKQDAQPYPYFSFASFLEGHERSMQVVGLIDEELKDLLEYLTSAPLRQPPIVILYSDHGLHYGPLVDQTIAGKVEARLPFLLAIIPDRYLTDSSKRSLVNNQERFATHRDFYWTLYNIATNQTDKPLQTDDLRRASLFDQLSTKRNCRSEGIPNHLCACSDDGIHLHPDLLQGKTN